MHGDGVRVLRERGQEGVVVHGHRRRGGRARGRVVLSHRDLGAWGRWAARAAQPERHQL